MEKNQLIENNSFILKIKRKFLGFWNKFIKKQEPKEIVKEQIDKDEILKLYQDIKDYKIDIDSLTKRELLYIIKLLQEEIDIVNHRIDMNIVETNIIKRNIKNYEEKIASCQ